MRTTTDDNHDAPIASYPGVFKTCELLNHYYWWLSQLRDVKTYVKGCSACQQNKALRQKKATPLNPHTLPESPWESISLDIIKPLPESNGFNAILSVIDRFSKKICLILTTTELLTKGWSIYTWNRSGSCMESLRRSPAIEVLSSHQNLWRNSAHN